MSSKSCRACRDWEEHYYWNHMDDEKKHFFKLMPADFTQSMTVPGKFADNFNGHISKVIDLRSPSGEIWHVGAASIRDELVIQSGWKEFVSAHNVEAGDHLLFRYSGESSFDVLIFDSSGCEKIPSIFVKKNELKRTKEAMQEEPCCHSLTKSHEGAPQSPPQSPPSDDNAGRKKGSSSAQLANKPNHNTSIDLDWWWQEEVGHEVKEEEDLQPEEDDTRIENGYYFCKEGPVMEYRLTQEDKEEISRVPVPVQPTNPVFVMVMHSSNLRTRPSPMRVPPDFAAKYIRSARKETFLQRVSKSAKWSVHYRVYERDQYLRGGRWLDFVRANGLLKHDICLFELMEDRSTLTFTVHILRRMRSRFVLLH